MIARAFFAALTGLAALLLFTVAAAPAPDPLSARDLRQVDRIVGATPLIILGEDSHRLPSIHRLAGQMFRHLVEKRAVRLLVFESAWGVEDALTGFMASDRTTLTGAEPFFLNAFASPETAALLVWIRQWNRAHPHDPVRIAGFQPEQPVTDYRALLAGAPSQAGAVGSAGSACGFSKGFASDLDYIVALSKDAADAPLHSPQARAACQAALATLHAALPPSGTGAERETALHLFSLRYYIGSVAASADGPANPTLPERSAALGRDYNAVDAARLHVLDELAVTRYAGLKALFWMHDWHAARHASEIATLNTLGFGIPRGTTSFGERLAAREGRRAVVLGTAVPCPAAGGCTDPADGIEVALATRYGAAPAVIALARSGERLFTTPATLLSNSNRMTLGNMVPARQFDALIYLPVEK